MFKKEYVFDKPNFYENVFQNTEEKRVHFGYFFTSGEKRFRGVEKENELRIYCTDYLFQGLNPLIKIKKNADNTTKVAITYNVFQWMLICLEALCFAVFLPLLWLSFDWILFVFILVAILCFCLNILFLNMRSKRIIELMKQF